MTDVVILGIGIHPFGRFETNFQAMGAQASIILIDRRIHQPLNLVRERRNDSRTNPARTQDCRTRSPAIPQHLVCAAQVQIDLSALPTQQRLSIKDQRLVRAMFQQPRRSCENPRPRIAMKLIGGPGCGAGSSAAR